CERRRFRGGCGVELAAPLPPFAAHCRGGAARSVRSAAPLGSLPVETPRQPLTTQTTGRLADNSSTVGGRWAALLCWRPAPRRAWEGRSCSCPLAANRSSERDVTIWEPRALSVSTSRRPVELLRECSHAGDG